MQAAAAAAAGSHPRAGRIVTGTVLMIFGSSSDLSSTHILKAYGAPQRVTPADRPPGRPTPTEFYGRQVPYRICLAVRPGEVPGQVGVYPWGYPMRRIKASINSGC